jgi:hypothetical protein
MSQLRRSDHAVKPDNAHYFASTPLLADSASAPVAGVESAAAAPASTDR